MSKKEIKPIDLTFRLQRQGRKDTKKNVEEELKKLREDGKEITECIKVDGHWIAYCKKQE